MPKIVYNYPEERRLELIVLELSPCTTSEILKRENIPVKPNTLETIKKRLDRLNFDGKIQKKVIARGNVYWHSSIEIHKKVFAKKL